MAEYKLNADQWNAVSVDEQSQIIESVTQAGAIPAGSTVTADPNTPVLDVDKLDLGDMQTFGFPGNLIDPIKKGLDDLKKAPCRLACEAAGAAAVAACGAFSGPAFAACIALAAAGTDECKKRC